MPPNTLGKLAGLQTKVTDVIAYPLIGLALPTTPAGYFQESTQPSPLAFLFPLSPKHLHLALLLTSFLPMGTGETFQGRLLTDALHLLKEQQLVGFHLHYVVVLPSDDDVKRFFGHAWRRQ